MKKTIAFIFITSTSSALAGNLELGIGAGVDSRYEADGSKVEGESSQYSLGYEYSLTENLRGALTLGLADFEGLSDQSIKLNPRLYYGNLFATAGVGYHKIDNYDSIAGLIGIGFRTNSQQPDKIGYGISLTQEEGIGSRKISQLNIDLVISTAL